MLQGYVAGRVKAERVVAAVTAAYYGARGSGIGTRLQPLMGIIERAHPGVVELVASRDPAGFEVRLAERPFPKQFEADLRRAAERVLAGAAPGGDPEPPFWARLYRAIRSVFTAST
ncbi:MAG: hypothetical protein ACRDH5_13845 [bacterium]